MIGFISGKLHSKTNSCAVINVNGVGYEILLSKKTLEALHQTDELITLEIHTHVNENAFQLFGFKTAQEKLVFQKLISVSGVGPKLALTVLSALSVSELLSAIVNENRPAFINISGVGKKTAERIILELKDKFDKTLMLSHVHSANDDQTSHARLNDVTRALVSLGYPETHAKKVVNGLKIEENDTVETLIKKSLLLVQA